MGSIETPRIKQPIREINPMLKKMMLLAVSACALVAFAVPAAAQAAELTNVFGEAVETETEVTATSSNLITTTAKGTLTCENVTIHGNVAENGPTVVINKTSVTTTNCKVKENEALVTITNASTGSITISGGSGSTTATFEDDIPAAGLFGCHLAGPVGFSYVAGTDVLSLPGSALTGTGPEGCPAGGVLEGSFTLENALGAVTID